MVLSKFYMTYWIILDDIGWLDRVALVALCNTVHQGRGHNTWGLPDAAALCGRCIPHPGREAGHFRSRNSRDPMMILWWSYASIVHRCSQFVCSQWMDWSSFSGVSDATFLKKTCLFDIEFAWQVCRAGQCCVSWHRPSRRVGTVNTFAGDVDGCSRWGCKLSSSSLETLQDARMSLELWGVWVKAFHAATCSPWWRSEQWISRWDITWTGTSVQRG